MNRVRVGILGTGTIVREFHLPVLATNPLAEVVALGNRHPESLHGLAARSGIEKTYTDFDRMADDPEIDAVVVALPNSFHAPVTLTMLRAGKHVFCEKPAAMTADEARETAKAAALAGRKLL